MGKGKEEKVKKGKGVKRGKRKKREGTKME